MVQYSELSESGRASALELWSIRDLLSACIISDSYVANAHITQAIVFSEIGESEIKELTRRLPKINPVTARMLVFLEFESEKGVFVDPAKTDIGALRLALSESITNQKIFFPWIHGREVVDELVRQFGVTPQLNSKETILLLRQTPIGVFQIGKSVVGPFGCMESPEFRLVLPVRELDGFVEVRNTERTRRKFRLATGENAEIFKASKQNRKLKTQQGIREYISTNNLISLLEDSQISNVKNPHQPDSILTFLAETLTFEEAKCVGVRLLPMIFRRDNGSNRFERGIKRIVGDVQNFISALTRQELQNIFHLATNKELFFAVDSCIENHEVEFLEGLSRFTPANKSGSRLEATSLGIRLDNRNAHGLFASNIMDLLFQVFVTSGIKNKEDLKFSLDSTENDLDLLIRRLVSSWIPERIVEHLCSQRDLGIFAGESVGIHNLQELSSPKLRAQLSYKLGVPDSSQDSLLDLMENKISQLESADVENPHEVDQLLHQVFNDVETVFKDVLVFSWWALIEKKDKRPKHFAYNHSRERQAEHYLPLFAGSKKDAEKPTLQPLGAAFIRLKAELLSLGKTPFESGFLAGFAKSQGRPMVFRYKEMFHNLNESSQARVISTIESIAKVLTDQKLMDVRNTVKHGNRTAEITAEDVANTISLLRHACNDARITGIYPEVWVFSAREILQSGLTKTTYKRGNVTLDIEEPTRAIAPGLPSSGKKLFFVPGCKLEHVGSLRFSVAHIRPDEDYWIGFPPELPIDAPGLSIPSEAGEFSELDVA
jgi:hypothetical protein